MVVGGLALDRWEGRPVKNRPAHLRPEAQSACRSVNHYWTYGALACTVVP